jgi:hypothetical protein
VFRVRRGDEGRHRRRATLRCGGRVVRVSDQPLLPRCQGRADHRSVLGKVAK